MNKLIFIIGLCLSMYLCQAQQTNSEKDILNLMEVNGSAANYDLAIDQMIAQYKMIKPNVPAVFWESARRDVFDKEIVELNKKIFEKSDKAFHFRQSVQEKCKHSALFSKIYVLPWGVDLSAKSVWAHKGLPFPLFKSADLEEKLFS